VQNMGGAGSVIGANYIFNVAQPDGLWIVRFNRQSISISF
jgi:hypothetical protein